MFEGKVVLITGGASGMGFLTGKRMAEMGASVALVDIVKETLQKCVDEIREITPNVIGIVADVRDYAAVKKSCDDTVAAFGGLDVLVTCAGGAETRLLGLRGDFDELPIEAFDFSIDLNLKGAVYFAHAALGIMKKQGRGGVIVTLGSITGEEGSVNNIGYSASKSALMNGVVKSLALAGEEYGIRAVCVAPGPVLTRPGMASMKTMAGRAAEPQELVNMILYVASDKGSFINGTTFLIDGGRSVMFNKK